MWQNENKAKEKIIICKIWIYKSLEHTLHCLLFLLQTTRNIGSPVA